MQNPKIHVYCFWRKNEVHVGSRFRGNRQTDRQTHTQRMTTIILQHMRTNG